MIQGQLIGLDHPVAQLKDHRNTTQLFRCITEQTAITYLQIAECLAEHFQLPLVHLDTLDLTLCDQITRTLDLNKLLQTQPIIPISLDDQALTIISYDPLLKDLCFELQFLHHLEIKFGLVAQDKFEYWNDQLKKIHTEPTLMQEESHRYKAHKVPKIDIDYLELLINDSLYQKVSDVHIEQYQHHARVRFRCDGLLKEWRRLTLNEVKPLISRIKVLANLDITEQRLPQDGALTWRHSDSRTFELRVSTLPTQWGEKAVLRMAQEKQSLPQLSQLGLHKSQLNGLLHALSQPQGLILVTGPTGSGKTVTLYSCLQNINNDSLNVSTAEDPVEVNFEGLNQIQINTNIGFSFAKALRSLLRQDPDIIMLGEIRDQETAEIAIRAAQTGHLVLSTLHTNSAYETLTRLYNLGISSGDLQGCLKLIVAQRLVRKLCPHCQPSFSIASGSCPYCHRGYSGRIGIFELLPIDRELLSLPPNQPTSHEKANNALISKQTLRCAAQQLIKGKITSKEEINRVLGYE
jgi:type II secretory ATPase GspE/PulE/Tfp pilus assembly ATPase PilB-like protein